MPRFRTEITEIHGLLELSLAAFRTADGMNLTVHQVFEQAGFHVCHNTIG
jgi:hypothetical protein